MSVRIELIDTTKADESTLRALHDLYLEWDAEDRPGDPVMPWPQRLADWRHLHDHQDTKRWVAWDNGSVVGAAGMFMNKTQDLDNAWAVLYVRQDHRRKGLARRLAREVVDSAVDNARKRLGVFVPRHSTYHEIPIRAGLSHVYNERVSQLRISELDLDLMREWVERAGERAGDYELLSLGMPVPPEHRPPLLVLNDVMNTAPMEDLEEDPIHWTDEMLASAEKAEARKKRQIHTLVARHRPTGEFAGFTVLVHQSLHPKLAHQWDTGVDPEHRNKGLGRWLKAAMILDFIDRYPEVEVIETENADSNEPMLNINVAMGFKTAYLVDIYQGPIEAVETFLNNG